LQFYSQDDPENLRGFRTILTTEAAHPYAGNWWPAGHIIGYGESFVNMVADVISSVATNQNPSPNFHDGVRCQEVLKAVEDSIIKRQWVKVK
ncbi:MAG TPA: gfo/Idh/MocA family oxidoreductase, partial [bacterium]|nr:gfo/Idh/MocA family oxidoreductase [bacterium]